MQPGWERFFDTFPTYNIEGYVLRALHMSDADDLHECLSDPEVTKLTSFELTSFDQITELIKASKTKFEKHHGINWALVDKKTNRVVGFYGIMWIDPHNSRIEVGCVIARAHWNKGISTKIIAWILDLAFSRLGVNRVEATIMIGNNASIRLVEKLGFQKEGRLRELRYCRGKYHDFLRYSLLQREWVSRQ